MRHDGHKRISVNKHNLNLYPNWMDTHGCPTCGEHTKTEHTPYYWPVWPDCSVCNGRGVYSNNDDDDDM